MLPADSYAISRDSVLVNYLDAVGEPWVARFRGNFSCHYQDRDNNER